MFVTKQKFVFNKQVGTNLVPYYLKEIVGLSSDSKPTTGVAEGSVFLEENTAKVFMMKANGSWIEL